MLSLRSDGLASAGLAACHDSQVLMTTSTDCVSFMPVSFQHSWARSYHTSISAGHSSKVVGGDSCRRSNGLGSRAVEVFKVDRSVSFEVCSFVPFVESARLNSKGLTRVSLRITVLNCLDWGGVLECFVRFPRTCVLSVGDKSHHRPTARF